MTKLLIAALLASLALTATASAQGVNPSGFGTPQKPKGAAPKSDPPPPALPGAREEPDAAPASKTVGDLAPNEALFDAINRGDLATAKDSVNRGADLNGVNVLGLTPIELAVDLGRNQISFYLLSLRGGTAGSTVSGPAAAPKPPTRAERLAADRAERAQKQAERARSRNAVADAAPVAPQTARLFSGGGGAPVPQAGFLGFDSGR